MQKKVKALEDMPDEHIIRHLETRHADDLKLEFKPLPGETYRRIIRDSWTVFHNTLHRLDAEGKYDDHSHSRPKLNGGSSNAES